MTFKKKIGLIILIIFSLMAVTSCMSVEDKIESHIRTAESAATTKYQKTALQNIYDLYETNPENEDDYENNNKVVDSLLELIDHDNMIISAEALKMLSDISQYDNSIDMEQIVRQGYEEGIYEIDEMLYYCSNAGEGANIIFTSIINENIINDEEMLDYIFKCILDEERYGGWDERIWKDVLEADKENGTTYARDKIEQWYSASEYIVSYQDRRLMETLENGSSPIYVSHIMMDIMQTADPITRENIKRVILIKDDYINILGLYLKDNYTNIDKSVYDIIYFYLYNAYETANAKIDERIEKVNSPDVVLDYSKHYNPDGTFSEIMMDIFVQSHELDDEELREKALSILKEIFPDGEYKSFMLEGLAGKMVEYADKDEEKFQIAKDMFLGIDVDEEYITKLYNDFSGNWKNANANENIDDNADCIVLLINNSNSVDVNYEYLLEKIPSEHAAFIPEQARYVIMYESNYEVVGGYIGTSIYGLKLKIEITVFDKLGETGLLSYKDFVGEDPPETIEYDPDNPQDVVGDFDFNKLNDYIMDEINNIINGTNETE